MATFSELSDMLEEADEECLAEDGQSFGAYVAGNNSCLEIRFDAVLWSDQDEPDADVREYICQSLEEISERIEHALGALRRGQNGQAKNSTEG